VKKKAVGSPRSVAGRFRATPKKPNPNVHAQTRKVLAKHYRAKYGVK
jgi:hypothetical protein